MGPLTDWLRTIQTALSMVIETAFCLGSSKEIGLDSESAKRMKEIICLSLRCHPRANEERGKRH